MHSALHLHQLGRWSQVNCSSSVELGLRRRTAVGARAAGCGRRMLAILVMMMLASTDAFSLKRWGKSGLSALSKRGTGGREKVKEDVAWLLEDPSDGGWKPVKDDGHVKVWKRSIPGSDFVAIKSSATLAVTPQALYEILAAGDIEVVKQYNPMIEHSGDLEVMDRDNKVTWSATMGIWPCRARDFVTHIRRATLADSSVAIINFATTHPKAPNKRRFVRGEILRGVFHIKAAKNKKHSEFTMVHHFNPGGGVPAWLINRLAEGKPLAFVHRLEKAAAQWDGQSKTTKGVLSDVGGFGHLTVPSVVREQVAAFVISFGRAKISEEKSERVHWKPCAPFHRRNTAGGGCICIGQCRSLSAEEAATVRGGGYPVVAGIAPRTG